MVSLNQPSRPDSFSPDTRVYGAFMVLFTPCSPSESSSPRHHDDERSRGFEENVAQSPSPIGRSLLRFSEKGKRNEHLNRMCWCLTHPPLFTLVSSISLSSYRSHEEPWTGNSTCLEEFVMMPGGLTSRVPPPFTARRPS